MASDYPHHTNSASFFNIPDMKYFIIGKFNCFGSTCMESGKKNSKKTNNQALSSINSNEQHMASKLIARDNESRAQRG